MRFFGYGGRLKFLTWGSGVTWRHPRRRLQILQHELISVYLRLTSRKIYTMTLNILG